MLKPAGFRCTTGQNQTDPSGDRTSGPATIGAAVMSVQLEFVGHACFRLWLDGRPVIVTDPYNHETVGLPDDGRRLEADTVIVSSLTDPAHDNVGLVAGQPHEINALDVAQGKAPATINGSPLITVAAREAPDHTEHTPMDNALYGFTLGGVTFVHMGDLGYQMTNAQLAPFQSRCDVFLVITGEANTPSMAELDPMIDCLNPRWIVPMHYNIPPISFGMSHVGKFINHRAQDPVIQVRHHTVTLPLPTIREGKPTIVVLEPSGYQRSG